MKKLITIIIPAYNEEKVLPQLFARLDKLATNNTDYDFEFLFINVLVIVITGYDSAG